ncbi:hypothetical protein SAMN02799630_02828 [Paenibacillus sp. UNCCL117]|uniref:hypothetical protein n=1 Tax=unclassified Paenibacillus TaxID=185978 RepID=UPI0008831F30|nr:MULTISPECIES: hypothetical protein [unclassified Paenibacillus]SDD28878.1 hypothetical protein SAMN04488602_107163 [Paenibacillus sp. cl123]SFW40849.1 hypothetical protein SAMN02799630_02828 [Paenibacillus sp. UNCCL117]
MNIDAQIETLYQEIGERCPFKAAKHMGIEHYDTNVGDAICGLYLREDESNRHIMLINSNIPIELQETACYLIIKHHQMHPGIGLALDKQDIEVYERAEAEHRGYIKRIADLFVRTIAASRA